MKLNVFAFAARLPLTLALRDYNAAEKIADLHGRLSTEGAPDGFAPAAGDLAWMARRGKGVPFNETA